MDILLIGGLWLDGSAWNDVVPELQALGHNAVPLTLPAEPDATLDDQVATVLSAVDEAGGPVFVVGHSAASTLAWLAADARPEKVAKVAFIGGWPSSDDDAYAAFFELKDGVMPFPGWEPFEGPDSADLDDAARKRMEAGAIPVPGAVANGVVRLTDDRRYAVPAVLICPEFTPDQAREWMRSGDLPELSKIQNLELVDIDSGHWPMFTQAAALARILADAAGR